MVLDNFKLEFLFINLSQVKDSVHGSRPLSDMVCNSTECREPQHIICPYPSYPVLKFGLCPLVNEIWPNSERS